MAKNDRTDALWANQMKKGWESCLKNRLAFLQSLDATLVAENTGHTVATVRNWFKKLVDSGFAQYDGGNTDIIRPAR